MKVALGIFVVLGAGIAGFLAYLGVFSPVKSLEMAPGPYTYVYEAFQGDYRKTGPVFDRVYKNLLAEGVTTTKGIGVYFDDPTRVPPAQQRSLLGSIIEDADLPRVPELEKKFRVATVPRRDSVVVEFPIRNRLSFTIGPMKGYPALMKHVREKGYKIAQPFEVYDMTSRKILYVMEIVK